VVLLALHGVDAATVNLLSLYSFSPPASRRAFWLLPTIVGMVAVGTVVVSATPAGTIRDPAEPPPSVTALVAVVSVGLLGALVTGVWQHRRRVLEDARILRSDIAAAAEISSIPEAP